MSAQKMLVVTLAKTNGVLAAATRKAGGVPAVADLVGSGLLARTPPESDASVIIPAEELAVKEVDFNGDLFLNPRAYAVDASGTLVVSPNYVDLDTTATTNNNVRVDLAPPAAAADKTVLVVIDAGPTLDPLKFFGKTVLNGATVDVQISGVPPGKHLVLVSVDGYNSKVKEGTF